jgi:hypothetical protein
VFLTRGFAGKAAMFGGVIVLLPSVWLLVAAQLAHSVAVVLRSKADASPARLPNKMRQRPFPARRATAMFRGLQGRGK